MVINHNLGAMNAQRQLNTNNTNTRNTMNKLSSGMRINKAADDASGLAVSEKMRSQIKGLNQAEKNVSNGISFIQTTEGYLSGAQDILHRLRELSVQSSNGIYTDEDRVLIQVEVSQLIDEIDRIANHSSFNGMNILTGRFTEEGMNIQIGPNTGQSEQINIGTMTSLSLGLSSEQAGNISLTTSEESNSSIGILDDAIQKISSQRAGLGAYQNRFETAVNGINISKENLQASESRIRDVNMASEIVELSKNQILEKTGMAMLAQANLNSQGVLSLLN